MLNSWTVLGRTLRVSFEELYSVVSVRVTVAQKVLPGKSPSRQVAPVPCGRLDSGVEERLRDGLRSQHNWWTQHSSGRRRVVLARPASVISQRVSPVFVR